MANETLLAKLTTTTKTDIVSAINEVNTKASNTYTLPTATASALGGVKIGTNITITSGVISVPAATTSVAGVMSAADKTKLDGIATGATKYVLPTATASVLGGVKNGANIVNTSGVLSVVDGTTSAKGVVQLNSTLTSTSTALAATASTVKTVNDSLTTHSANYINHNLTGTTTGVANTYVLTPSPALSAYAKGNHITLFFNVTNTGASTINISSKGAKKLLKNDGSDYANGELKLNTPYTFVFNGTDFLADSAGGGIESDDSFKTLDAICYPGAVRKNKTVVLKPKFINKTAHPMKNQALGTGLFMSMAISKDGKTMGYGTNSAYVSVQKRNSVNNEFEYSRTMERIYPFGTSSTTTISHMSFSADGKYLYVGSSNSYCRVMEFNETSETYELIAKTDTSIFNGGSDYIFRYGAFIDGTDFLFTSTGYMGYIMKINKQSGLLEIVDSISDLSSIVSGYYNENLKILYLGGYYGQRAAKVDTTTGRMSQITLKNVTKSTVYNVDYLPDNGTVAFCGSYVDIYDSTTETIDYIKSVSIAHNRAVHTPDGKYLVSYYNMSDSYENKVHKVDGSTYTAATSSELSKMGIYGMRFDEGIHSVHGSYMLEYVTNSGNNGRLFELTTNSNGPTIKQSTIENPVTGAQLGIALSRDEKFLYTGYASSAASAITVFKNTNGDIQNNTSFSVMSSGISATGDFSPVSNLLAVGISTSPYLVIYSYTDDGIFTKLANPSIVPGAAPSKVEFSKDGTILTVHCKGTIAPLFYSVVENVFTKIEQPSTNPSNKAVALGTFNDGKSAIIFDDTEGFLRYEIVNNAITSTKVSRSSLATYISSEMVVSNDGKYIIVCRSASGGPMLLEMNSSGMYDLSRYDVGKSGVSYLSLDRHNGRYIVYGNTDTSAGSLVYYTMEEYAFENGSSSATGGYARVISPQSIGIRAYRAAFTKDGKYAFFTTSTFKPFVFACEIEYQASELFLLSDDSSLGIVSRSPREMKMNDKFKAKVLSEVNGWEV